MHVQQIVQAFTPLSSTLNHPTLCYRRLPPPPQVMPQAPEASDKDGDGDSTTDGRYDSTAVATPSSQAAASAAAAAEEQAAAMQQQHEQGHAVALAGAVALELLSGSDSEDAAMAAEQGRGGEATAQHTAAQHSAHQLHQSGAAGERSGSAAGGDAAARAQAPSAAAAAAAHAHAASADAHDAITPPPLQHPSLVPTAGGGAAAGGHEGEGQGELLSAVSALSPGALSDLTSTGTPVRGDALGMFSRSARSGLTAASPVTPGAITVASDSDDYESEDDESESAAAAARRPKTDHFGFFLTSDRAAPVAQGAAATAALSKEESRARKWLEMRRQWDTVAARRHGQRALKRRARKGIPDTVRGEVWQLLSGSKARMAASAGVYEGLVASDLKVDGPIEEDIPRTMFDHEMFCKQSHMHGHSKLRRVLLAYGRHDREVQYCQWQPLLYYFKNFKKYNLSKLHKRQVAQTGINYIAALFLLYMPEEEAFWMLVCVMHRPQAPLRELFLPGMLKAREFNHVMDSLTEKFVPKLFRHLQKHDIQPTMYAHPWFITCFTQAFPYELCTRTWDVFLEEDWKIMYRVCLALFKHVETEVCSLDLEQGNLVMRRLPAAADGKTILDLAMRIPLKHKHIAKRIRQFHAKTVTDKAASRLSRSLSNLHT
ncbi:rab-GTPase-TBC domain-containing protein [Tribonema minus]|uniref:Rab-GTPase-TBC domain-containing protein n=1 Tax=Tribonema minus TaxID=303371 RepID=A0A835YV67_9STRA|nr:rab-GTPase-TBC domain-containing protein [Tribonema minus]